MVYLLKMVYLFEKSMLKELSRYLILLVILITAIPLKGIAEPSDIQFFKEKEGLIRGIDNGIYKFYNSSKELLLSLDGFNYASDFTAGIAIVKGQGADSYGAINKSGELIIDTVWHNILPPDHGYLRVALKSSDYVIEDRGNGIRKYSKLEWFFAESKSGNILDEISFVSLITINGLATGIDQGGNSYLFDVSRINPGFYDPFMKAMLKINGVNVYVELDQASNLSNYKSKDNHEVMVSLEYNENPFEKYKFD